MVVRTLPVLALVACASGAWAASSGGFGRKPSGQQTDSPMLLMGGVSRLVDGSSRDETAEYGFRATLGLLAYEKGMAGIPWIDFDWSRSSGHGNRLDSLSAMYTERIPLGREFYFGLGLGTFYENAAIQQDDGSFDRDKRFSIGGKALVGINFGSKVMVEAGYYYSPDILGLDTKTFGLSLGIRF